jgi:outer membrane biosynthesis protein TonB
MVRLAISILGLIFVAQCGKETQQAPSPKPQPTASSCDFSSYKPLKAGANAPAISMPRPDYPPEAKAQKLHGQVTVKMLINFHTGIVEHACVVSGDETLGKAATEAALKSRFSPDWGHNKYLAQRYDYAETYLVYNFVAQ